jgi:IS5 family transposase
MEFQVLDRLSFQRFLGLRRSSQVPDRATFWIFRERLTAAKAGAALFEAVNRQLAQHGYLARGGQIVDASLVPVPRQHVTEQERELIKEQATPADWKPAERRQRDVDATWTKKHGKSYFGDQLSISADRRYQVIRKLKVSTASENDTRHLEDVLDSANTGRDLYGDKGYVDGGREARLKAKGWRVHIQRKAEQDKPLSACQKRRNTRIARVRARVEHVFAAIDQMGGKLPRCIGLDRADFLLTGKAATYHLRRLCSLKACGVVAF